MKTVKSIILLFVLTLPNLLLADSTARGEEIFKKRCAGCHGVDGETMAFGISRKLHEIPVEEMKERMKTYMSPVMKNASGVTAVMSKQTAKLNKKDYDDVVEYIIMFSKADNPQ